MTHLATYVGLLHTGEGTLADSLRLVADGHAADSEVHYMCRTLAGLSDDNVARLDPLARRYGAQRMDEPERLHAEGLSAVRPGPVGLLRDLQDLHALATLVATSWAVVRQAAHGARDRELLAVAEHCGMQTARQRAWLITRITQAAPQALLAAP